LQKRRNPYADELNGRTPFTHRHLSNLRTKPLIAK
jgi:hypothetical protein